jgi:NADH:ubiquinone oxidoreductase subunit F (NADH-binding)
MAFQPGTNRLLAGPGASAGPESLHAHETRLGSWATTRISGWDLIAELEQSGVLGRGGAGFPVGRKWRSIAVRAEGRAVVLANGAEGEPRSHKDRVLMAYRPHLVLDGALLAAEAVGASEVIVYVGEEHVAAKAAMREAIAERAGAGGPPIRFIEAPIGYVAGEASAAVSYVNRGLALPTSPPRPSERGVAGRPTLVQNVESLAYAALIARFGAEWYREPGRIHSRGTALVTVGSLAEEPRVREIELGTPVGEVAASVGLTGSDIGAALVGGYFGTWTSAAEAWGLRLDPETMQATGRTFGCGMVSLLPADACGVAATAGVIGYLARSSAGQCGPCKFGLAAIAASARDLASCRAGMAELDELEGLLGLVEGRGACHHPDGAAALMASALSTFGDEFERHARLQRCIADGRSGISTAHLQLLRGEVDRVA